MAHIFGSIWDRFNRNALNDLSKSVEQQGKSIQDLVAEGQLTPTQYADLVRVVNGLIAKGDVSVDDIDLNLGKIGMTHLAEDVKQALTGQADVTAEVADEAVTTPKIFRGAVTPSKLSEDVGLYGKLTPNFVYGNLRGDNGKIDPTDRRIVTSQLIPFNKGDRLVVKKSSKNDRIMIGYYDFDEKFINRTPPISIPSTEDKVYDSEVDGFIKVMIWRVIDGNEQVTITPEMFSELSQSMFLNTNKLKTFNLSPKNNNSDSTSNTITKNIKVPLEADGIRKSDGIVMSNQSRYANDDYTKMQRTGRYLRVAPGTSLNLSFSNGSGFVFEYDENFEFLRQSSINSNITHQLFPNSHLIKFSFENLITDDVNANLEYTSFLGVDDWVYNTSKTNRPGTDSEYVTFIYETSTNEGLSVRNPSGTEEQYSEERYFNSGVLKLPPNYDPHGKPVKLIVWFQGSGGYLGFNSDTGTGYNEYHKYLLNEGYAIFSAFTKTTKYPDSINQSVIYSMPTSIAAVIQGYKHVVNNYNISKTGAFISGKSSGGFDANNISYQKAIPILATGLLAPTFNAMDRPYGSHEDGRMIVAQEFGFTGNHSVLADRADSVVPERTPELKQYMIDNAEKMMGYNPWTNGLIGEDIKVEAAEAFEGTNLNYDLNKDKLRLFPVPLKIWFAKDDKAGNIGQQIPIFTRQIMNTNGNVEVREMPDGTGGHNSVDNATNALKVPQIKTKLGITQTNVPLAYVELAQYFRRFENE